MENNGYKGLVEYREQLIDQVDEINKICCEMQLDREDLEYKLMEVEQDMAQFYEGECIF